MLYIVTALYEEALPFLEEYSLKKDLSFPHFELFSKESIRLLITKPGTLRSAIALSSLLAARPSSRNDFLLSIGTAACGQKEIPAGTPFFIRKITDSMTGRCYYPELLYRFPFQEAELATLPHVLSQKTEISSFPYAPSQEAGVSSRGEIPLLFDMEGSGIYEAASTFLCTHQIAFVKIVSDHMSDLGELSFHELRSHVTWCIQKNLPAIRRWLSDILTLLSSPGLLPEGLSSPGLSPEESALFQKACAALRLSVTSRNKLHQLMLYLSLSQIPYQEAMQRQLAPYENGCRTKKEGLLWLENAFRHFLQ